MAREKTIELVGGGSSVNSVLFQGNLGTDPEVFDTDGDNPRVSMFTLLTDSWYNKKEEEWVNKGIPVPCSGFGEALARSASKLKKGDSVIVEGSLDSYKNADDRDVLTVKVRRVTGYHVLDSGGPSSDNSDDEEPF